LGNGQYEDPANQVIWDLKSSHPLPIAKEIEPYDLNSQSFKIRGVPVKVFQTNMVASET
jgi:hypothetical protein